MTKNKDSYCLHYLLKYKINTVFRANIWTCSHKNATSYTTEIRSHWEKQNHKQTHIPVDIFQ